jgi:putative transposase
MLKDVLSMSERLAGTAVELSRSTYRNLPQAQTLVDPDPDAEMRAWLRSYATKHPCRGFRLASAALRYGERREVNKKTFHRLWREGPPGQGDRSAQAGRGVLDPADRG